VHSSARPFFFPFSPLEPSLLRGVIAGTELRLAGPFSPLPFFFPVFPPLLQDGKDYQQFLSPGPPPPYFFPFFFPPNPLPSLICSRQRDRSEACFKFSPLFFLFSSFSAFFLPKGRRLYPSICSLLFFPQPLPLLFFRFLFKVPHWRWGGKGRERLSFFSPIFSLPFFFFLGLSLLRPCNPPRGFNPSAPFEEGEELMFLFFLPFRLRMGGKPPPGHRNRSEQPRQTVKEVGNRGPFFPFFFFFFFPRLLSPLLLGLAAGRRLFGRQERNISTRSFLLPPLFFFLFFSFFSPFSFFLFLRRASDQKIEKVRCRLPPLSFLFPVFFFFFLSLRHGFREKIKKGVKAARRQVSLPFSPSLFPHISSFFLSATKAEGRED